MVNVGKYTSPMDPTKGYLLDDFLRKPEKPHHHFAALALPICPGGVGESMVWFVEVINSWNFGPFGNTKNKTQETCGLVDGVFLFNYI